MVDDDERLGELATHFLGRAGITVDERCIEEALKKTPWSCPEQDTSARLGAILCVHRDERPSNEPAGD